MTGTSKREEVFCFFHFDVFPDEVDFTVCNRNNADDDGRNDPTEYEIGYENERYKEHGIYK